VAQSPHTAGVVGVADQSYVFTSADDLPGTISLTAGALDLDLTQLSLTEDTTINVDLGAGDMVVRLPEGVNSSVTWSVGLGEATVTGEEQHEGASLTGSFERHVNDDAPTVLIMISLGAGALEVRP